MNIYTIVLGCIAAIHKGTVQAKILGAFLLSSFASPFVYVLEKLTAWQVANSDFLILVLGAIAVDHAVGSWHHLFKLKDWSWRKNGYGLIEKLFLVVCVMFLFEGVDYFIQGQHFVKDYTITILRLAVFMYPAGSALANVYETSGKKFPPPFIMDWVLQYFKKGKIQK